MILKMKKKKSNKIKQNIIYLKMLKKQKMK